MIGGEDTACTRILAAYAIRSSHSTLQLSIYTMSAVLVTGITGFLGAHVAHTFLQHSHPVHATLRSPAKLVPLLQSPIFSPFIASGQLKLFVVGDLEVADYGEAMKGVERVVHTAFKTDITATDFRKGLLDVGVDGMRRVFDAVDKSPEIKSVVITSSMGACNDIKTAWEKQAGTVVTDDTWNSYTLEEVDELCASKAPTNEAGWRTGMVMYMVAKKYAELFAWEQYKAAQARGKTWSLTAIIPTMILGPPIQPITPPLLMSSVSTMVMWLLAQGPESQVFSPPASIWFIDVRDCAEEHYRAAIKGKTGRYISGSGIYDFQQITELLPTLYPDQAARFAKGEPGQRLSLNPGSYRIESKMREEFGVEYRGLETVVKDTFDRLFELEKQGL
ncbi:hypothetical protein, variant 1 [Cryptococcus amylolentus CBS 6039]|uniref:NAD-dependent epimerase/dehydratase domain-containing protein n=1 Tax=Cryptococcus amylolentus CBS 6039 TaxID=1295533 RepID=A0A1E3HUM2_9TREE|nr:hypothetical protein, variant 1 [Cryptococcus amylolentus CBS 6039]ODN80039.1 hypothetical protein, variant 1 [Cryptococcus amylolentus CBS 6039]